MDEFQCTKSFDIDKGELDGLTLQQCFVLGYELAQIDSLLKTCRTISRPVHANNRLRIEAACQNARRLFVLTWLSEDSSEMWMQLNVAEAAEGVSDGQTTTGQ